MRPYVLMVIFIAQMSHGYKVTQSLFQNFYPNQSAIIVCEHSAQSERVEDFRLHSVSGTNKTILCQKGSPNCKNIFYQALSKKVIFLLLNIGEEAMQVSYQCEFILQINQLYSSSFGEPIKLQPAQKETRRESAMSPPPLSPSHPPLPHKTEDLLLMWILTGLLVFTLLYSSFVTCCCIRLMRSDQDGGNPIYVEMRKSTLSQNIYCNERFDPTAVLHPC
ncbi:hypothetical protein OJAV_G00202810 [Oryzias javanicus]|uniref:Uncharacterized protein n=1 Tax=Oryzias javanicus TaxID=123683 RepID=A0A3S2MF83_ORYJA|nr:hypothetical protein OJAV_G00202810 [Oryzias javanicus]